MKKTCFVIIGFGVKTDFETGRTINLDKTFENIIKPVFDKLDILCYRSCDLDQSGVIDVEMYENILKADFVVADISTLNPNAIYELGVRHALRPNTTIVIAEKELKLPFDINHVLIHSYEHLGSDIGYSEVMRFQNYLEEKVKSFIRNPKTDSPVYTFLPKLNPPSFSENEIENIQESIDKSHSTSDLVELAEKKKREGDFKLSKALFKEALDTKPNDSFIIQRLALVTYKGKQPSDKESLYEALQILDVLHPINTTDPETLGLLGAIHKRLYELEKKTEHFDLSLHYYERGYYVKQDYYNGINTAFLYTKKASEAEDVFEKYANYGQAKKIWREIIKKWTAVTLTSLFQERGDKEWIYLTLAEANYGLDNLDEEEKYLKIVSEKCSAESISSYLEQKEKLGLIKNEIKI